MADAEKFIKNRPLLDAALGSVDLPAAYMKPTGKSEDESKRKTPKEKATLLARKAISLATPPAVKGLRAGVKALTDPVHRATRIKKSPESEENPDVIGAKKGGVVSASKRADGCAKRGKTKGRMV